MAVVRDQHRRPKEAFARLEPRLAGGHLLRGVGELAEEARRHGGPEAVRAVDDPDRGRDLLGESPRRPCERLDVGVVEVDELGPVVRLVLREQDPRPLVEQADVVRSVARRMDRTELAAAEVDRVAVGEQAGRRRRLDAPARDAGARGRPGAYLLVRPGRRKPSSAARSDSQAASRPVAARA
jgi:hypothetical protein